jgi:hypothetical protein
MRKGIYYTQNKNSTSNTGNGNRKIHCCSSTTARNFTTSSFMGMLNGRTYSRGSRHNLFNEFSMEDLIRLFSVRNFTSKKIFWKAQHVGKIWKRNEKLSGFENKKLITEPSYFVVVKSYFISQNLIWVEIKVQSNSTYVVRMSMHDMHSPSRTIRYDFTMLFSFFLFIPYIPTSGVGFQQTCVDLVYLEVGRVARDGTPLHCT